MLCWRDDGWRDLSKGEKDGICDPDVIKQRNLNDSLR
jgi:hypothetical protein